MQHRRNNSNHNGAFGGALGAIILTLFTVKLAWSLLVPNLFAGAVAAGTVSASIPWSSAALIAGCIGATVFFIRHPRRHVHGEHHLADGQSGG